MVLGVGPLQYDYEVSTFYKRHRVAISLLLQKKAARKHCGCDDISCLIEYLELSNFKMPIMIFLALPLYNKFQKADRTCPIESMHFDQHIFSFFTFNKP